MSGCIACLEKDDRYPHTCNKGANSMTEREHHPLCDFMLSNCVERCDCKTEEFKKRMERLDKQEQEQQQDIEGVRTPSHYMLIDDIEAIEVIARSMTREQFKGYCLGNILKYRLRAGKKSELAFLEKDMAKAGFYGELFEKHKDKCYDY